MAGPKLDLMGYEAQLKIGTAGSQAATLVEDVVNVKFSVDITYGSTTKRGAGTSVPIQTSRPTSRKPKLTFNTLNTPATTALTTIKAAACAGTAISILVLDIASGATLCDMDCYLKLDVDAPLEKEQDQAFEVEPSRDYGRTPIF